MVLTIITLILSIAAIGISIYALVKRQETIVGAQGPKGEAGMMGPRGCQGFQGDQGYQGRQGAQGERGYQGFQGFQGNQGYQGTKGVQGSQGVQGVQGKSGKQYCNVTAEEWEKLKRELPKVIDFQDSVVKAGDFYTDGK